MDGLFSILVAGSVEGFEQTLSAVGARSLVFSSLTGNAEANEAIDISIYARATVTFFCVILAQA